MTKPKSEEFASVGGRGTTIERCTCNHEWQDKRYGKKMRVHNNGKRQNNRTPRKCTVCSKVKT